MKEIGIEKLIELLNEYENSEVYKRELTDDDDYKDIEDIELEYNEELGIIYRKELTNQLPEAILVSKSFGFIKWLVDNDKIDFELDRIIHKHKGIDFNTGKGIAVEKLCDKYESLLMLLAISDTPIEDLISYLK